jgi:hypothetical protein
MSSTITCSNQNWRAFSIARHLRALSYLCWVKSRKSKAFRDFALLWCTEPKNLELLSIVKASQFVILSARMFWEFQICRSPSDRSIFSVNSKIVQIQTNEATLRTPLLREVWDAGKENTATSWIGTFGQDWNKLRHERTSPESEKGPTMRSVPQTCIKRLGLNAEDHALS